MCGRSWSAGETFHSAVFEQPAGFERRDWCEGCWPGAPGEALCHFRTRAAERTEKKRLLVDDGVLLEFFTRLGEQSDDPIKRDFRFVLSLVLMRRRLLKYEGGERTGGEECWLLRRVGSNEVYRVVNPQLDESRIGLLTGELSAILHGQAAPMDEAASVGSGPGDAS